MSLDAPDAATTTAPFVVHPATTTMSADMLQEGSSTRPRSRTASKRLEGSTSSTFSSSNGFEISSAELFVKIPPSNAPSGHAAPQRSPRRPEAGRPSRPSRSTKRFPATHEEDEQQASTMPPGHTRKRTLSSGDASTRQFIDVRRGRQTQSENGDDDWSRRARVLSLPRQAFKTSSNSDSSEQPSPLTPSAFNDIPPMPIFSNRRFHHRHQDSGATQQSGTSSSIYPMSSSTGTDSYMSPPSLPSNDADHHIIAVDPNDPDEGVGIRELDEMDADDVSYRLRLLMQNNYYLPPAHLKPFDYSPVSESPKKSPKSGASPTTFLDIFKVGKLRSSPKTGKGAGPILRATGEDSTVSGIGRPQHARPPANQAQHLHLHMNSLPARPRPDNNKKGRVVVVRERMDDIVKVAKQVEQELKVREAERKKAAQGGSRHSSRKDADELNLSNDPTLIDPTDCVDLPPLSSDAFLDPHAAALSRMAMEGGIGASVLADQLPPHSPGMWSFDSEEEAWRKALLQEAVGHSLNNTPIGSPHHTPSSQSPFRNLELDKSRSPTPPQPGSRGSGTGDGKIPTASGSQSVASPAKDPAPGSGSDGRLGASTPGVPASNVASSLSLPRRKRELGQRILSRMIDEDEINSIDPTIEHDSDDGLELPGGVEMPQASRGLRVTSMGSIVLPGRAETPTIPIHPLAPPPRKTGVPLSPVLSTNSPFDSRSTSSEQLFIDASDNLLQSEDRAIDNNTSERLADAYETHVGLSSAFGELTPRPADGSPSNSGFGRLSSHGASAASISSGSHYSEDDEDQFHTPLENNTAVHLPDFEASRPSLTVSITPSESTRTSSEYSRPSPTTSAFRDALDRSIYSGDESRRQSVANTLGKNSYVDEEDSLSRVPSRVSDAGFDPRYAPVSPPPRTSSSLAQNVLYPPPLSRYQHRSSFASTSVPTTRESMDTVSERSVTPEAEPATPLARSRAPLPSLDLEVPELREPSLRSETFAASPISFFDAVEAQNQPADDESDDDDDATQVVTVDNEDEDDEDEDEEFDEDDLDDLDDDDDLLGYRGGYQSDAVVKSARLVVDPLSRSVRNVPRDPRLPLGNIVTHSLTQLRNHSSPQLAVRTTRAMSDVGYGRPSFQGTRPPLPKTQSALSSFSLTKLKGKGKGKNGNEKEKEKGEDMSQGDSFLMMTEAPPRRSTSSSVFERLRQRATTPPAIKTNKKPRARAPTVSAGISSDSATPPGTASTLRPPNRPWTSGPGSSSTTVHTWREEQSKQDQSMRRLDGMVIEHMERERDILKRITTTLAKS